MERQKIKSNNVHSAGHDATGLEVQFHGHGCAARTGTGCDCHGGEVYHYAGVEKDHHTAMLNVGSPGTYFHHKIKQARDAQGELKYPATKRT